MHRPVADALASIIDASSLVESGCTLTFYSLADVLQEVYTDTDWATAASTAGVLTANSAGRFPLAYFKDTLDYKAVLKDSGGTTIATINPIYKAAGFVVASDLGDYILADGSTPMTGPLNFGARDTVSGAASIDLDNVTSNYLYITNPSGDYTDITSITLSNGSMRWCVIDSGVKFWPTSLINLTRMPNGGAVTSWGPAMLIGSQALSGITWSCVFVGESGGVVRMLNPVRADGRPFYGDADITIALGDETTAIAAATDVATFRNVGRFYISSLRGSLTTAQTSGNLVTVDVNVNGTSILTTKLTIDNNETTSTSAATSFAFGEAVTSFGNSGGDLLMTVVALSNAPDSLRVQFTKTGTLPTGLALATNYYLVAQTATTYKIATSQTNAAAGTFIAYTDAGSGTITVKPAAWPVPDDAEISIDIDDCDGSTTAAGLKLALIGAKAPSITNNSP